jgi:hypothetical protein
MPGFVVTIVGGLEFGWGEVVAMLVDSSGVEPVDAFHGRDLDLVPVTSRTDLSTDVSQSSTGPLPADAQ